MLLHKLLDRVGAKQSLARGRLRARWWRMRGVSIGQKVVIGSRSRVDRPWCLRLGNRFTAEEFVYFKIVSDHALLEFGEFGFVGRGTEFDVIQSVKVGDHTVIAPGCFVTDHNHGASAERRIDEQEAQAKPVTIGNDVWLGANVVVLAGVTIGDGAVVGANAVVTRNVPRMAVVAGIPARILRFRDERSASTAASEGKTQTDYLTRNLTGSV